MFKSASVGLVAVAAVSLSHVASANVLLDFNTDQYTPNFRASFTSTAGAPAVPVASVTYDETNQNVAFAITGGGAAAVRVYDTNPGTSTNDDVFATETISFDATFNNFTPISTTFPSVGIYGRVTIGGSGILALLNPAATDGTSVRLRLFSGASITGTGVGTSFFDQTFSSLANPIAAGSPLKLTLTQIDAADPVFNFTVSDAQGLVAASGDRVFTTNDTYNNAGAVGIRLSGQNVSNTIAVDNFAINIPEPASMALVGLAGLMLLPRRRLV